jgi:hypothetical protein
MNAVLKGFTGPEMRLDSGANKRPEPDRPKKDPVAARSAISEKNSGTSTNNTTIGANRRSWTG